MGETSFIVTKAIYIFINYVIGTVFLVFFAGTCYYYVEQYNSMSDKTKFDFVNFTLIIQLAFLFIALISMIGTFGGISENQICLKIFRWVLGLLTLAELVFLGLIFFQPTLIKPHIESFFIDKIDHYDKNSELQELVNAIQKKLKCCGVTSPLDWNRTELYSCSSSSPVKCGVPYSCCIETSTATCGAGTIQGAISNKIFNNGCVPIIFDVLTKNAQNVGIMFGVLLFFQILLIILDVKISEEIDIRKGFRKTKSVKRERTY